MTRTERPFAEIRRSRQFSLDHAAVQMRISPRYLRSVELGHTPLSWVLATRMARVYGCGVMDLRRPAVGVGRG